MKSGDKVRACTRRIVLLLACAALTPFTIAQVSPSPPAERTEAPPPSAYTGDAACAQCHRKESEFYGLTPHARDSAPATAKTIVGSFSPGHNVMHTGNPNLVVNMIARPDGFYQSAVNLADPSAHLTQRFDIVIGSGRHGQTYLYWDGDDLYELPASYWTWDHEWVISPGFPAGQVHFDRAIVPRCLECHASYFTWLNPPVNHFAKHSLVLGIGCERCHGPAAVHVARERAAKPPVPGSSDEAIVNPARLTRERQLGLCALCHAGAVEPLRTPLTFVAGDNVRDFLAIQPATPGAPVDVHGNQVGALEQSKCFGSGKMTCSTCHDVHEKQENADAFSQHCLTCHEVSACGRYRALGAAIRTRCVDCHMPLQESAKIVSDSGGGTLHAQLRAHQIAIYRDAAERVERSLQGK
jgi:mono/diheme cytochrome c family protein